MFIRFAPCDEHYFIFFNFILFLVLWCCRCCCSRIVPLMEVIQSSTSLRFLLPGPAPPPREPSRLEQSEKDGHLAASRQPFRRVKAERRVNVIDWRRQRLAGAYERRAAGADLRRLPARRCPFVFRQSLLGCSASSSTSSSSAPNLQFAA